MKKVYFPVLLALILFCVDKVALIPAFRKCCTIAPSVSLFRLSLESDFRQDEMIAKARKDGKKIALNFGSSRSLGYYSSPTPEQLSRITDLTPNQKKEINEYEFINSAAPGASIVTGYVRLVQWLDHGVKPDLVTVELSRFSLNRQSLWINDEIKNGVPLDFTLTHLGAMPQAHVSTIVASRVFALSRYRVGAPQATSLSIWETMFNQITTEFTTSKGGVTGSGVQVGQESPTALFTYKHVANEMHRTMFSNYHADPDLSRYVYSILERCKKDSIPLVFWNPPAHPVWQSLELESDKRKTFDRLLADMKKKGAIYVDMNGSIKCMQFVDPVHIHTNCIPEMALKQIRASKGLN